MLKKSRVSYKALLLAILVVPGLGACKSESKSDSAGKSSETVKTAEKATSGTTESFIAKLEGARPGLKVTGAEETAVDGLVRVDMEGAGSVYHMKGTEYFVVGELYQVADSGLVNISEQEKEGFRAEMLAKLESKDMIVFSPAGDVKGRISVFTDVDCGYCRKLHQEVPELNKMGIEVRYLAYPRAGVGSPSYQKIASAWCADDPRDALTKLKNLEEIPTNVCEGNPVANQYTVGGQMGVRGTPAIVLDDGVLLPGYMPAADLAKRIGLGG